MGQHHYYRLRTAVADGSLTYSHTIYLRMPAAKSILLGNLLHSTAQPLRLQGVAHQARLQLKDLLGAILLDHTKWQALGDAP